MVMSLAFFSWVTKPAAVVVVAFLYNIPLSFPSFWYLFFMVVCLLLLLLLVVVVFESSL